MPRALPDAVYYDIEAIHEYNVDIGGRELYLVGEVVEPDSGEDRIEPGVDYVMGSRLIKNMRFLVNRNTEEPILIHLKSCGGDWHEGMAIYNTVLSCPVRVVMLNYTHARSMSSIILQAADHRVMMPDSVFMFHLGSGFIEGTQRAIESALDFYKPTTKRMINIYVDRMLSSPKSKFKNWTHSKIFNMIKRKMEHKEDVYLTAKEAVEWGLADMIFDGKWSDLKTA